MGKEAILVTGGAGYIGSHTCKALSKAGYLPVVYDNLSTGHAYAVKWGPFVHGDLADKAKLKAAIASFNPVAVLHFAADALVVESMFKPAKYYRNNVAGTLSLLEAMCEANLKALVFSSTCATYGELQFAPMTEAHPQVPINPYGRTKWIAEQMMAEFDTAYGLKTVALRYFNAAGADLDTEIGENHTPESHLIPIAIQTALGMRPQMKIYGTDFPTRDGSAIRDYIHVQDLAFAHVLALQFLLEHKTSDQFNLGTGSGTSVLEIVRAVESFCCKELPVHLESKRAGEPPILTASAEKATRVLGWTPHYSDLPTIIESAWKWHKLLHETSLLLKRLEESKCLAALIS